MSEGILCVLNKTPWNMYMLVNSCTAEAFEFCAFVQLPDNLFYHWTGT